MIPANLSDLMLTIVKAAPVPAPAIAAPATAPGWVEPQLVRDELLVCPVSGDISKGVPRAQSAKEKQKADAVYWCQFDADLAWVKARADWGDDQSASGVEQPLVAVEEVVVEKKEGEPRKSERKRKGKAGGEVLAQQPKRRR